MLYSLAGAALAAVAVVVTTASVVVLQREENSRTKDEFESYRLEAAQKISEANARALEARAALEKFKAPRSLNWEVLSSELKNVPKQPLEILYSRDDPDSFMIAMQLLASFRSSDWNVAFPTFVPNEIDTKNIAGLPLPAIVGLGGQLNGITVVAKAHPENSKIPNPSYAGLISALAKALSTHVAHGGFDPSMPEGKLRIIVAPKSPVEGVQ